MLATDSVAALFDRPTREAIAKGLCIQCKAARLLCGKSRCPILVRHHYFQQTLPLLDSTHLEGSSPPGVFIGRFGYPKVLIGPLVPPFHGNTEEMDLPEMWLDRPIDEFVKIRSQLVRGTTRVSVTDAWEGGRMVQQTQDLALSTASADVEAEFTKKPYARLVLNDDIQPHGPIAPLRRFDVGNVKLDPRLEKRHSDTDLKAGPAVQELYKEKIPVSKIQRAFSVGAFGLKKRRKFVPTRWSITAVDDILGKDLRERAQSYPTIDKYLLFESWKLDNRFIVLLSPRNWQYELIEAWYPNTVWNPLGQETLMYSDSEGFEGRTTYASIGGCYYAARFAVGEYLTGIRRQAAVTILREAHPGYILPVGVWNVRENVRNAFRQVPNSFETLQDMLFHASQRLEIPMSRWIQKSALLKDWLYQRRLEDFRWRKLGG